MFIQFVWFVTSLNTFNTFSNLLFYYIPTVLIIYWLLNEKMTVQFSFVFYVKRNNQSNISVSYSVLIMWISTVSPSSASTVILRIINLNKSHRGSDHTLRFDFVATCSGMQFHTSVIYDEYSPVEKIHVLVWMK